MAFTPNINQANLQAQARLLNEQKEFEGQRRSQVFAASESQKAREQQTKLYNLKAGDKFSGANPVQSFDDTQKNIWGDTVALAYSDAQSEILESRKLIHSGNTQKRIEGQMRMTKANNSLKQLAEESMIFDEELEEAANNNNIPDRNNQDLQDLYKSSVDGTLRLISNTTVSPEERGDSKGRFVQYQDGEGNQKMMSLADFQKIKDGATPRQDVNTWLKSTSDNLEQDKSLTEATLKREAVVGHVQNYLSDPQIMRALQYQFGGVTPEEVQIRLEDQLMGTKGTQAIQQRAPAKGRTLSPKELSKGDAYSQRAYDIEEGIKDIAFVNNLLAGNSAKHGDKEFVGNKIESVTKEGNNMKIRLTNGPDRVLAHTGRNIHNLLNEITYNLDESKLIWATASSAKAQNFGAAVEQAEQVVEGVQRAEDALTRIHDSLTEKNKEGDFSINNKEALKKSLIEAYPDIINSKIIKISGFFNKGEIQFNKTPYNISTSEGAQSFMKDVDAFIKAAKGRTEAITVDRLGNLPE